LLDIQIEVKGDGGEPKLKPPSLSDWERVRVEGSGTQQSISIINGRMSRSFKKSERWILKPKRSGRLGVGAFVLTGEGSQSRSQPFEVLVTGQQGKIAQPLSQAAAAQSKSASDTDTTADQIFLRWNSKTAQPFVGEPFVAFLDLYYDASLRPTSLNGFE
jgi:hypothetical protein